VDGAVLGVIAIPPAVYAAVSVRRTRFALRPKVGPRRHSGPRSDGGTHADNQSRMRPPRTTR